jgi:competence protein ComEA
MLSTLSVLAKDKIWAGFLIAAMGLTVLGLIVVVRLNEPVTLEIVSTNSASQSASIWVDVQGAVLNPGVYQLPSSSRVKDALVAAGGLTEVAGREVIAKSINLAAPLEDGDKLYFANYQEAETGQVAGSQTISNLININTADSGKLQELEGIGPARANAIIAGRPYAKVEELLSRKVIPESVYLKISTQLSVY